jgi:hypothetical protein
LPDKNFLGTNALAYFCFNVAKKKVIIQRQLVALVAVIMAPSIASSAAVDMVIIMNLFSL